MRFHLCKKRVDLMMMMMMGFRRDWKIATETEARARGEGGVHTESVEEQLPTIRR